MYPSSVVTEYVIYINPYLLHISAALNAISGSGVENIGSAKLIGTIKKKYFTNILNII